MSHTFLPYYLIFINQLLPNKVIRLKELGDIRTTKVLKIKIRFPLKQTEKVEE